MALVAALALVGVLPFGASATNYYADCSSSCPGKGTEADPWCSIAEVNVPTFQAGDILGFKAGTTCDGTLAPKGSGTKDKVIQLTKYGSGANPTINGTGAMSAVKLTNQDYWQISNLHVTNPAASIARRQGIFVDSSDGKDHFGITISNNVIEYVAGQTNKATQSDDFVMSGGILVGTNNATSSYSDVLVSDNSVSNCGGGGIKIRVGTMQNQGRNIHATRNNVAKCGGDGIIASYAYEPLLDYNIASDLGTGAYPWTGGNFAGIWVLGDHNPTISHNVVYGSIMSAIDSEAFDCDWGNTGNCTVEYNYSRDNAGGAFLNCDGCGTSGGADQIVRYNIFENDCRMFSNGDKPKMYFYQNVMYCADKPFEIAVPPTTYFTNNIIVGNGSSTLPNRAGISWEWNVFQNVSPPTLNGIHADPQFVKPGAGGNTLAAGDGYKLKKASPAFLNGAVIANNGGQDFFGNAVSSTSKPNRGAYNGPGV